MPASSILVWNPSVIPMFRVNLHMQIARSMIGDGERITVALVAEPESPTPTATAPHHLRESSRVSQALANSQSRSTVLGAIFKTSTTSSTLSPPK